LLSVASLKKIRIFSKWASIGILTSWGGFSALFIAAIYNFEHLFIKFHMVLFENEFWILDPDKSVIINLLPKKFFVDAFIGLMILSGISSIAVALAIWGMTRKEC